MAESTFGRRAVNDGKLVSRLREGARITPETLQRVNDFLRAQGETVDPRPPVELMPLIKATDRPLRAVNGAATSTAPPERNFRFFDNRQKYLLFVHTCSEKDVVARRVGLELQHIHPKPPAIRLFDAGMGDGTVLTNVMREMHRRFQSMPFYICGKEISLEDVRLSLHKMADRFFEHPASVLVVTNMFYAEAPWLTPKSLHDEVESLIAKLGPLPSVSDISAKEVLTSIGRDKKVVNGTLHFVAAADRGRTVELTDVTEKEIKAAVRKIGLRA